MKCSPCGTDLPAGSKFCGNCGARLVNVAAGDDGIPASSTASSSSAGAQASTADGAFATETSGNAQEAEEWNGKCIAGFIFSLISLVFYRLFSLGTSILLIAGFIFSALGYYEAKRTGERGMYLGTLGVLMSLGTALEIYFTIYPTQP